jgi:N-acyl homoserine lactone hydrolase
MSVANLQHLSKEAMLKRQHTSLVAIALILVATSSPSANAQTKASPVTSLRVYLFDCGLIKGEDPIAYGLKPGEVQNADMVVPCYLVLHPKGTLMWDVGVIPDSAFPTHGPVSHTQNSETVSSPAPLLPQLSAIGYPPSAIRYVAFSHYHSDHVANANAFAGSTWLVHNAERDAMFAAKPEQQSAYRLLETSKTVILPDADYDVFGDGTVIIKPAPGHTPGHQVLALRLPKTGPVLIGGDLWHYTAERTAPEAPRREANRQQTMASRAAMEDYLKRSGAQLWIEHDPQTFARLKKAPEYNQ